MAASRCSECGGPVPSSVAEGPGSHIDVAITPGMLARHQELMTTNAPPEAAELAYVQAIVSKTDVELTHIEKEISRLQARLQQLRDEHGLLSRYRAQNTAILSPLRRMPPEVLGEIFSWTLPSIDEGSRKFHIMSRSPWVLTYVSSRWRAVALSTPSLWSQIVIDYRLKHTHPSSISMIKTQIERAHQLRIHFYGTEKRPPHPQIEMFRCLAAHCSQWEVLSIQLTSPIVPLLAGIRNHIPSLHTLIILWEGPESQTGVESIDCFQMAPSLLDISILNRFRYVSIPLPANQLTRYDLDGTWETHRGILKLATNLVEAHIAVDFNDAPWPGSDEVINLTLLRRLYVTHPEIFQYLRAPSVQEIALGLNKGDRPKHILPPLESFVMRSGCSLRRLCLYGFVADPTAVEILRKFPSVSELAIITADAEDAAYKAVNALISNLTLPNPTGGAVLAPRLSKIHFGCENECFIDYTLYLQMLESRWKAQDCALEGAALIIRSGPRPDPTTLNALNMLRQDGLDFLFLTGSKATDVTNRWTMCR
ncbi:hypothetical protein FB451DRAFT_107135 [Mycena latifolia]|nr:hypothetical protein FB451DRAFT_107135 [Mycena latifolia]